MKPKTKDHSLPKQCKTCGVEKSPEHFYIVNGKMKSLETYPRREPHCIPCRNKKISERKKNMGPEWHKIENERKKKWYLRNIDRAENVLRNARLKREFGITLDDYNALLESQKHSCAICGKQETKISPKTGKPKMLAVDHCHTSGKVRGLLCFHCNSSIGKFKEDINIMSNAIEYLKKHKGIA